MGRVANARDHQSPARARPAGAAAPGGFSLSLLGGFELRAGDRPLRIALSAQRVVAFLALNPGRRSRIFVAGNLWTLAGEERAAGALRTALWRLGQPAGAIVCSEGQWLRLDPDLAVDVDEISRSARAVLDGTGAAVPQAAFAALRDVGELLPDYYDDWALLERERLRQLRLHALERVCDTLAADGRYSEATEAGLAAVASEPLRESAHRALIGAHLAAGNPREALRQYDVFRRLLRRDLNVAPSHMLEGMIGHLRRIGQPLMTTR